VNVTILGLVVLPAVSLFAWTWMAWGNLGGPQGAAMPLAVRGMPAGSLGLLFDREHGLVSYAPVFLLLPACWMLAWRAHGPLVVPVLLVFLPAAAFLEWFAGFSPAARYLVPVVPLLALPAALALRSRALRWIALPIVLFQAAISAYVWQFPRTLWPRATGSNQVLEAIPVIGPLYSQALPSMRTGDSITQGLLTAAGLALATALVVLVARKRRPAPTSASSTAHPDDMRR
jgi:LPXTG-motif cell wall-anchored protein